MGKTVNCSIQDELESSLLQIENVGLPGEVCVLAFSQLEEVSLFYQLSLYTVNIIVHPIQ